MDGGMTRGEGERDATRDVPSREPFRAWLDGSLTQQRDPKSASVGPISERHHDALGEVRRDLLRQGYSRRQLANGNLMETAIELLYAYVRDGRRVR